MSRIRPGVFFWRILFSVTSAHHNFRLGWHLHGGWISQPMLHLARHGVPFFGLRLDLAEKDTITCGQTTFDWFTIRDLDSLDPTGAVERKICSVRQNVRDLQGFLQKLGVSSNLSSNLEACPNKTWGRAWKQGRVDDAARFWWGHDSNEINILSPIDGLAIRVLELLPSWRIPRVLFGGSMQSIKWKKH